MCFTNIFCSTCSLKLHTLYSFEFAQAVLFSPYGDLRLILPVLNSPTHQFSYIMVYKWLNLPSFKFTLSLEGEKGENKTRAKFSLYTVHIIMCMRVIVSEQECPLFFFFTYFQARTSGPCNIIRNIQVHGVLQSHTVCIRLYAIFGKYMYFVYCMCMAELF